jgi:glycosyltransferase involved in cell wall biosynthesis
VHQVVSHSSNKGLARAFTLGIQASLQRGADIIVNTDADNQYCADDIPALIKPILDGRADMVIGARPIATIAHFSPIKKLLQLAGTAVVRLVSGAEVADAPSGFRAFSRGAAVSLNVFSRYTYTLETIIQAGQKNLTVVSVPVRVNGDLRPSRLVSSIGSYVRKSVTTIVRMFVVYRPFRFFMVVGGVIFLGGVVLGARFLICYLSGDGSGMVQSLILAAVLLMMGFHTMLLAFVTDLLAVNRKLLEDLQTAERERSLREHSTRRLGAAHAPVPGASPSSQGRSPAEPAKLP